MSDPPSPSSDDLREIIFEEDFPNCPTTIWQALTASSLIMRWLGMEPTGFAPVVGTRFTYRTDPAGVWDGTIQCEVLEVVPNERLVYSWCSGDAANVGYGAPLKTLVAFTLTPSTRGTRVRLVHSGFRLPQNNVAYDNMSKGWAQCARNLHDVANDV